jgi:hypothetical protein
MTVQTSRPTSIEIVRIWLKSFIPATIETASPVPGSGEHTGKTMLPTPGPLNHCFLTDQRHYSADYNAQARMHSDVEINITENRIIQQQHRCSETIEVDCETGEERCRRAADTDGMSFHSFEVSDSGNRISVQLDGSSKNPCLEIASIKVSPNLDYSGVITIQLHADRSTGLVSFDGKIEIYPAFEMYVTVNGQEPQEIFVARALPGSTPLDLVGPPARAISRTVQISV